MSKIFSGKQVVVILSREFGFYFVSQRGSHVKLRRRVASGDVTTIVPLHRELAPGTLRGVLQLAKIDHKVFLKRS